MKSTKKQTANRRTTAQTGISKSKQTKTENKRTVANRKTVPKRPATKRTTKRNPASAGTKLPVRPKSKPTPRVRPVASALNGSDKMTKLVKAAKKEGERTAMKRLMKSKKAQTDRVLKSSKEKINRLLKENKARITEILRGGTKRRGKSSRSLKPSRPPKNDNPFETRRFRGRRKKKETSGQRLKRIEGNVHTVRDQILYGIADGSFKFKWASIAKETGYGEGERKKMLSLLDNKGYTVNSLAHKIWEDNDGSYGRGKSDDVIRDEILDVLQTVSSRTDALNLLDRGQGNTPF
jgi:hypothetical protein